jgi:hypothetical protein
MNLLARSAALLCAVATASAQEAVPDPFSFFGGAVTLSGSERARLESDDPVVRLLPRVDREMAIFAAVRADIDGVRLLEWVRDITELKKSEHVQAIGRFSSPPRLDDLAGLSLDAADVDAIRRCRPRSCGLKLSDQEMALLAQAAAEGGDGWRQAVQDGFRRVLLARVEAYLASGYRDALPYHDQRMPVALDDEFAQLLGQSPFLAARLPQLHEQLQAFPTSAPGGIDTFLYWSKERLGGKPVVVVTHVFMVDGSGESDGAAIMPDALVASRQVYANHYMTGSLAVTAVFRPRGSEPGYLTYLNRSRLDVLGGLFAPVTRLIIERRLRAEAATVVDGLRARLESGRPD